MTQAADRSAIVADFEGVVLEAGGERFTLRRREDEHWVQIEDLAELASAASTGRASASVPAPVHVRLSLVTGSHHMQVFWLPTAFGNAQLGFPFTWLIDERRWAPRNAVFLRDPEQPPVPETWNMTCIRCHVTAGQPRPRPERETFETRVGELGIACEACHGPGETHVRRMEAFETARRADPMVPRPSDSAIVQPAALDPVRGSQVCGQCHGMKWFDHGEGWTEHGFRYRPGEDLEATTPMIRPGALEEQPRVAEVVRKHPTLLEEFFWSDGTIRVAGREFSGLIESACFQRGQMSCFSCHSMHEYATPDDQLGRDFAGDRACLRCHAADRFAATTHTHHPPGSSGARCDNCHMPHTTYGLLGAIRQHRIDSPNVAIGEATGRPNACNLCHLDRSLAWTEALLRAWYGHDAVSLPPEADRVSAGVRWLLSGDAGQRALAAWHFGWAPAREVSGSDWMVPLLGELFEDPYPAVRLIAYRSLRRQPDFASLAFDFVGDPPSRRAVREEVQRRAPVRVDGQGDRFRAVLRADDGSLDRVALERWVRRRDDRPVHLRE